MTCADIMALRGNESVAITIALVEAITAHCLECPSCAAALAEVSARSAPPTDAEIALARDMASKAIADPEVADTFDRLPEGW